MSWQSIAVILGVLFLIIALLRLVSARMDRVGTAPEKMIERLSAFAGGDFFRIKSGIANAYLLPCDGGYLLIDTGYPEDYERFRSALAWAGIDQRNIKWLFLTHAHDDHVGFAARLIEDTGCRLIAPALSLGQLAAGRVKFNGGGAITRRIAAMSFLYNLVKRRTMSFPPLSVGPGICVLSGEDVSLAPSLGIAGSFVPTPGHSGDSFTLLLDDGRCFCADAAMNFLNALGADYRPIFVEDEDQAYRSLRALVARGAKTFFVGHGAPIEDWVVLATLERHQRRIKR